MELWIGYQNRKQNSQKFLKKNKIFKILIYRISMYFKL